MADARAHRPRKARQGAHERLVVERPELFGGAAAPSEDHHIEIAQLRKAVERGDDRFRRADSLHLRRSEHELDARVAARDDRLDVSPGSPNGARDHADPAGRGRQRPLACGREEPFRREPALERLELQVGVARACRP